MNHDRLGSLTIALLFGLVAGPVAQSAPGELDVRFGTHGQAWVPGQIESAALIVLPDGRMLVFGVPKDATAWTEGAIGVARLLADGSPDAIFGSGGHVDLPLGSEPKPVPTDATLLDDGRILVAGRFRDAVSPDGCAQGWLVRLSPDAAIDATFGVGGIARAGPCGVDRIVLLPEGAIAAGAPGFVQRLDSGGTPALFPGSDLSIVPVGSVMYGMSAMVTLHDGSVLTSAGFSGPFDSLELFVVSARGVVVDWSSSRHPFRGIGSFAAVRGAARYVACGNGFAQRSEALIVQRFHDDGLADTTFAPTTAGRVELGAEHRPDFIGVVDDWRAPRCRALLAGAAGSHLVIGDWPRPYEYGGGRVLLARLDAEGAADAAFDPSGRGREIALGGPEQWSSWHVLDAAPAHDGAVILIARRSSKPITGDVYFDELLIDQPTLVTRVEVSPAGGAGAIGFNVPAARIAERNPAGLQVHRSGGTAGPVSVDYELLHDTADAADIVAVAGTLTWPDSDAAPRTIALAPVDDDVAEGEERFRVRLSNAAGGAELGAPEIEVTIEDDEALRALELATPALEIMEGRAASLEIRRPATTPGPIVVRYAVGVALDPHDGAPRPLARTRLVRQSVGELRWSGDDTTSRTLMLQSFASGSTEPNSTSDVALADVSGTLWDGEGWKAARVTVIDDTALFVPPPPPSAPARNSGGGAISCELLWLLAIAALVNFCGALALCRGARRPGLVERDDAPSLARRAPGIADRF